MGSRRPVAVLLVLLSLLSSSSATFRAPRHRRLVSASLTSAAQADVERSERLMASCDKRWFDTYLDHFAFANTSTFPLRYYYCDEYYVPGGPIFYYVGNEADVTIYVNATGLMWEHAEHFNALLVFAEHRYFGESQPFPGDPLEQYTTDPDQLVRNYAWLTPEQAIADHASLLFKLRNDLGDRYAPVIGFGGSYGGLLGTWMRVKYPHLLTGMIAASVPIGAFDYADPAYNSGDFDMIVTKAAGPYGGASVDCAPNVNASWPVIEKFGETEDGRKKLESIFGLCTDDSGKLNTTEAIPSFEWWIQSAFESLAMGNLGISSNYFTDGGYLPAWPLRVACDLMGNSSARDDDTELLTNLAKVTNLYYNASGDQSCLAWNTVSTANYVRWIYLACSSMFTNVSTPVESMFPPYSNSDGLIACNETWGFFPDTSYQYIHHGAFDIADGASNIVFSNGLLDPWHTGGVLEDLSDTLVAVVIPGQAHHADLAFSSPDDSEELREARALEIEWVQRWIEEARAIRPSPFGAPAPELAPSSEL